MFLWADAKGQYRQVDGGVVPGHDKDDDTVKKTHISVKMEFMHNVSDGNTVAEVPIRFNTVQVRLSSSLVVNNSVIVVPWEGNYALERFDDIQRQNLSSFDFSVLSACFLMGS